MTYRMSPKAMGIYAIECIPTKQVYIGQSVNILSRWNEHLDRLGRGMCDSQKLLDLYRKHGPTSLSFKILEIVQDREKLQEREKYWIKATGAETLNRLHALGSPRTMISVHRTTKHALERLCKKGMNDAIVFLLAHYKKTAHLS